MNELDEVTDESHDEEAHPSGPCDEAKLLAIGLGALLDQVKGVTDELLQGLDRKLVKVGHEAAESGRLRGVGVWGVSAYGVGSGRVLETYNKKYIFLAQTQRL